MYGPPGSRIISPHRKKSCVTKCYTGPNVASSCEHGKEHSGSIKGGELFD